MNAARPGYVDEKYLLMLAALANPIKARAIQLLRLKPGMSVVDVGCGPASDTLALAEAVGPSGAVLGIDTDPDMVDKANQRAKEAGVDGYTRHVRADAASIDRPSSSFDGARSERLFQHLKSPELALAEMVRLTKPGGRVVVIDTDHTTLSLDTTHEEIEWKLRRSYTQWVANGSSGRQLQRLFRRAGLQDVTVEVVATHATDFRMLSMVCNLDRVSQAAIAAGHISQAEWDTLSCELSGNTAKGQFFGSLNIVLAAGTRAAASFAQT